jgi:hypothetical protein
VLKPFWIAIPLDSTKRTRKKKLPYNSLFKKRILTWSLSYWTITGVFLSPLSFPFPSHNTHNSTKYQRERVCVRACVCVCVLCIHVCSYNGLILILFD